jgi:hypothetical protein
LKIFRKWLNKESVSECATSNDHFVVVNISENQDIANKYECNLQRGAYGLHSIFLLMLFGVWDFLEHLLLSDYLSPGGTEKSNVRHGSAKGDVCLFGRGVSF